MNVRAVRAVAWKDLRVVVKTRAVMVPLVVVPVLILVALPLLVGLLAALTPDLPGGPLDELRRMLERLPAALRAGLEGYSEAQQLVVLGLGYLLAPLFLILPLMVSSVVAADSFAGEKERKTLEALLYTPTSDRELFVGKLLAAWLPAVGVSLLGFVVYTLVANLAAWPVLGAPFLPNALWLALALWVAPATAALGLGLTVLVSARVRTFQEAFQLGGLVVLPLAALVVAQASGLVYLGPALALALGLALWGLALVSLWLGARRFGRDALASRL